MATIAVRAGMLPETEEEDRAATRRGLASTRDGDRGPRVNGPQTTDC